MKKSFSVSTLFIYLVLAGLWIYCTYYYFCEFLPDALNTGSVILSLLLYLFISFILLAPFIFGIIGKIKNSKGKEQ